MIRAVRCDRPQFKTVVLQPGFNVILAERTKESTKKDSRNGLGKTTLIEIIHFCLGAAAKEGEGIRQEPIKGWTYFLDIELGGRPYTISRSTDKPGQVSVVGDWSGWPIQPHTDPKTGRACLSVHDWNKVLGWLVFNLQLPKPAEKYLPTFRSLISYFVRKGRDAFSSPFEHYRKQFLWDRQVNTAFLLGLGWEYARKWQLLRDREDALRKLKEIADSGTLAGFLGTVGELDAVRFRLEEQIELQQKALDSFRVHAQYREIEERASSLTAEIHQLSNENVSGRRMVEFYESSLVEEKPASPDAVSEIYGDAGIVLPGSVVRRLEEVQDFHRRVTINRRNFLASEIARQRAAIAGRDLQIRKLVEERASLLLILQTHGALEEYTKLQLNHVQLAQELENVKTRIENLEKLERERSALKIEREQLGLDARADHEERKSIRQRAISLFNANSEALYAAPGKLVVDIDSSGFRFQVDIERSGSQGIEQMKVFCFDLLLAQLWSERASGPGFIVHDSTIFDGVDERQVAQALQMAARESETRRFQYVCCLNSDLIPEKDFDPGFDLLSYARLILTDATEDGSLLGVRF